MAFMKLMEKLTHFRNCRDGTQGRCLVINEAQALRDCLSSIPNTRARNIIPCDLSLFRFYWMFQYVPDSGDHEPAES